MSFVFKYFWKALENHLIIVWLQVSLVEKNYSILSLNKIILWKPKDKIQTLSVRHCISLENNTVYPEYSEHSFNEIALSINV